jgi:DNA gyrase/topoisomerase IV subunit A
VAEIKLRNINKEYILKRVEETSSLEDEIEDLEDILHSPRRLKKIIVDELSAVSKKYGEPRNAVTSHGTNLPLASQPRTNSAAVPSAGKVMRASGITGQTEMLHVPQKTNPANAAKSAVKARKYAVVGFRRI